MQLVDRPNFFSKSNALNQVVKNTSCSHGWLRLVVQIIFGAITVASFIMILLMAMQRPKSTESRCMINNCRVTCSDMRFDKNGEADVISAAMEAGLRCVKMILTLRDLKFVNNTMPMNWMSRMPTNIYVLNIVGGNLHHIPSTAFVGQFAGNIKVLLLEDITISQWMSTTFVGLSSLNRLFMKNCAFGNIARNALRAVDDTVNILTVTHSGRWNPTAITGYMSSDARLDTVDFSFNDFGNILTKRTFYGLKSCKTLYLNSCRITSIGAETFDSLINIELLFLSDNFLYTVPTGLFESFLMPNRLRPRIHLENNPWYCDCLQKDLIQLSANKILPVDTTCNGPDHLFGKTIKELENYCYDDSKDSSLSMDIVFSNTHRPIVSDGASLTSSDHPCFYGNKPVFNRTLKIVSPVAHFQCHNISIIEDFLHTSRTLHFRDLTKSNWLKPTFILQQSKYTVIQVSSSVIDHGLLWYQSSCPNEIYCLNTVPNFLRVYNTVPDTEYTFCPFDLRRFAVSKSDCVYYNLSTTVNVENIKYKYFRNSPLIYVGISLLCLGLGAMCVYIIIRMNPILLKGSKRLLFVKHRNVDALVLPPKIPLRKKDCLNDDTKMFTVPDDKMLYVNHFIRSNSVRSDKSNTPTYISALQPTESQLAEWRIRHHFDKSPSIISISSDISTISRGSDCISAGITANFTYESLK